MNHHGKRWITGLLITPLLVAIIFYGSEGIFTLFIVAVIQIAVWEYNNLVFDRQGYDLEKAEIIVYAVMIPLAMYLGNYHSLAPIVTFCVLTTFLLFLYNVTSAEIDISRIGKVILGFIYIPLFMSYFIALRHLPGGIRWVFYTIFIAVSGDSSAFYIGRTFGRKKLQLYVSPGKTTEGAMGQIIGTILGSIGFQCFFFHQFSLTHAIIVGLIGGILAQLGDLFESAIKRAAGAKDAGTIFPGHGGMLDRLDSMSFLAPFVFYYQHYLIK